MGKIENGDALVLKSGKGGVTSHWNQYWRASEGELKQVYATSDERDGSVRIGNRPGGNGPWWDTGMFNRAAVAEAKFKVGDRVKSIGAPQAGVGVVDEVNGGGHYLVNFKDTWFGKCSEYDHTIELAPPTFKTGDIIRVTTDQDTWVYSGMVGTVLETAATNMHVDFGNDKVWWVDYVNAEAAPLRIEAGKYYVDTTGKRVGPMEIWSVGVEHPWCAGNDIYRGDGSSDYGPNLVREAHTFELREVVKDGVTVKSNMTDSREPKFKVGDRVLATGEAPSGETGTVVDYDSSDNTYFVKFDTWTEGHGYDDKHWWVEAENITFATSNTAIVAKLTNGEPRPSLRPYVHANVESAKAEAQRLADMTPGTEFAVYERVDIRKVEKKYDHEWQRLAANGNRDEAAEELHRLTGMRHSDARMVADRYAV